jgi:hypothetical protein
MVGSRIVKSCGMWAYVYEKIAGGVSDQLVLTGDQVTNV